MKKKNKILVTGCAGFIGFHFANKLISQGYNVYGVDNINSYYDVDLKKSRISILKKNKKKFKFFKKDICDKNLSSFFQKNNFYKVFHFAAQAGVRYSLENPEIYQKWNVQGLCNLLELSKKFKVKHFIFASSSSVYGDCKKFPVKETFPTSNPKSFYAATKKIGEVVAYSYSSLYKMPITVLRFFTVYGPYGRPDMALFKFVKNTLNKNKIEVFNKGKHVRDFTYIGDAIKMIYCVSKKIPKGEIPYDIFNLCGSKPQKLIYFIKLIEKTLGTKVKKKFLPLQEGDVLKTYGSNKKIMTLCNFKHTSLKRGILEFINWYKKFYLHSKNKKKELVK